RFTGASQKSRYLTAKFGGGDVFWRARCSSWRLAEEIAAHHSPRQGSTEGTSQRESTRGQVCLGTIRAGEKSGPCGGERCAAQLPALSRRVSEVRQIPPDLRGCERLADPGVFLRLAAGRGDYR